VIIVEFHEKLDFLMNITKTSNSLLAQYTFLDASHISRLRRGERKLVKDADYLKNMSAYFARQCVEEYQKKALLEVMGRHFELPQNEEKTATYIYNWLVDSSVKETDPINDFLDDISRVQFKKISPGRPDAAYPVRKPAKADVSLFYGLEGKRDAALSFLTMVVQDQKPNTLLLYSDESIDWLTGNLDFLASWADLMSKIIQQGGRIKIIHTVNRNLDEMLEALTKWMPLYMTGAIEPYYYPKIRDGVFKRTMFIAPNIAAVTSTSLDAMTDKAVNMLVKDVNAIAALSEEFNSFFSLCKPLMRIFTSQDTLQYMSILKEFELESADAIVKANYLSLATMPAEVADNMLSRADDPYKKELMDFFLKRKSALKKNLTKNRFYEIVQLPDLETIKAGCAEVGFAGIEEPSRLCYRPEEYKAHLEEIIQLLRDSDNYQFNISKNSKYYEYRLYVKEDLGAIVIKTIPPHAVFAINESNLTAAFWDYLSILNYESQVDKNKTIHELQKIVDAI
jgi:hypothetical protein